MLYHISATVKPIIIQFKTSCSRSKRLNYSFDSICISDVNIGSPFNSILLVGSGYIFVIYSIFSMNALDISIKSNLIMSFHFSINALDIGTMSSLMMSLHCYLLILKHAQLQSYCH